MTIAAPATRPIPGIADDVPEIRRSVWRRAWIFCRRQPLGTFGILIVVITAIAGLSADWIAPYSPTANDFAACCADTPDAAASAGGRAATRKCPAAASFPVNHQASYSRSVPAEEPRGRPG